VTDAVERFAFNVFTYDYTGFDEFRYVVSVQDPATGQTIAQYRQEAFGSGTSLKTTGWRGVELSLGDRIGDTLRITISAGGTIDHLYGFWAYVDSADLDFPDPVPVQPVVSGNGSAMTDPLTGLTTIAFPVFTEDFGDLTLSYPIACPGDETVSEATFLLDGAPFPATVSESGVATVLIPADAVETAAKNGATITMVVICSGGSQSNITLGQIVLYDPSGYITDAVTGQPVAGAQVHLYNVPGWSPKTGPEDDGANTCQSHDSKGADDPWDQPAPTELGQLEPAGSNRISPNVNPFISNADGYYGWDVAEGCWYVTVQAAGLRAPGLAGRRRAARGHRPRPRARSTSG
jgi:hypothetical protein